MHLVKVDFDDHAADIGCSDGHHPKETILSLTK